MSEIVARCYGIYQLKKSRICAILFSDKGAQREVT